MVLSQTKNTKNIQITANILTAEDSSRRCRKKPPQLVIIHCHSEGTAVKQINIASGDINYYLIKQGG